MTWQWESGFLTTGPPRNYPSLNLEQPYAFFSKDRLWRTRPADLINVSHSGFVCFLMHVDHSERYIIEHIYCLQICTSPPFILSYQLVPLPCLLVPAKALISSFHPSSPSQWGGVGRECGGISISFKACMTSLFCIVYYPVGSPLTSSPFLVFLGVSEEYLYFPQVCADSHLFLCQPPAPGNSASDLLPSYMWLLWEAT